MRTKSKNLIVLLVLIASFQIFLTSLNKTGNNNVLSIENHDAKANNDEITIYPKSAKSANSEIVLEPLFSNITNVLYNQGVIQKGDLDSLKYIDDDKYLIAPTLDAGKYKFDVRFQFDVDLGFYPSRYYELYLYLDIDAPQFENELVYFQVNQSFAWKTIATISSNETHIERLFIEDCFEFRIYAEIDIIKMISIDRIRFMHAHTGRFDPYFYIENEVCTDISGMFIIIEDPNWWVSFPDDDVIYQKDTSTSDPYAVMTMLSIIMDLGSDNIAEFVECTDLQVYFNWTSSTPTLSQQISGRIWNWEDLDWDFQKTETILNQYYTFNWASDINSNINSYINENLRWRVQITSFAIGSAPAVETEVWLHESTANVKVKPDCDYPDINISSSPSSPISTLGKFNISANVSANPSSSTITSVKYTIFNETWSSGWNDMNFLAGDEYYKEFDIDNLDLDNYTVLVNVSDSSGLSTYEFLEIELNNSRPEIQFVDLNADINRIEKLHNYELKVLVNDLECDICENVSLMFYNETNHAQFAKWQNMTCFEPSGCYNYIFNPVDFSGGLYTITVRAADPKGFGYNSTKLIMPTEVKDTIYLITGDDDDDDDDDRLKDQNALLLWGVVGLGILSVALIFTNIIYIFLRKKSKTRDFKNRILKKKRK